VGSSSSSSQGHVISSALRVDAKFAFLISTLHSPRNHDRQLVVAYRTRPIRHVTKHILRQYGKISNAFCHHGSAKCLDADELCTSARAMQLQTIRPVSEMSVFALHASSTEGTCSSVRSALALPANMSTVCLIIRMRRLHPPRLLPHHGEQDRG
jgi:hypothetical protein